jgi:phage baseplate assembly protein V
MDVDHASQPPSCRVSSGDMETNWLPRFALAAGETRDWNQLTKGEQAVLFCPCGDPAQGIVLRTQSVFR